MTWVYMYELAQLRKGTPSNFGRESVYTLHFSNELASRKPAHLQIQLKRRVSQNWEH